MLADKFISVSQQHSTAFDESSDENISCEQMISCHFIKQTCYFVWDECFEAFLNKFQSEQAKQINGGQAFTYPDTVLGLWSQNQLWFGGECCHVKGLCNINQITVSEKETRIHEIGSHLRKERGWGGQCFIPSD